MALQLQITRVSTDANGIDVTFSDGVTMEFPNVQAVEEACAQQETADALRSMILKWWLVRSGELTNQTIIDGKVFTLDFAASQVFKVV